MNQELEKFIRMSNYAGERFDLIQAGGGNTSVKLDNNQMIIKASGYLLSEVDENTGYALVDNSKILSIIEDPTIINISNKRLRDQKGSEAVNNAQITEGPRPSIETYLHSLLYKYTLHVHAISVNMLTSVKNWEDLLNRIAPEVLLIKYETPGIDLAIEMNAQMKLYVKKYHKKPSIICLQNHGLIITSNSFESVQELTEEFINKVETFLKIDFKAYKATNILSKAVNKHSNELLMSYLSEDAYINSILKSNKELFFKKPFCPDGYVFCGYKALEYTGDQSVIDYLKEYKQLPKLIIYNKHLYIVSKDLKKAKMIEDVLKNNLLILKQVKEEIVFLDDAEIAYLGNWDAEKYRQNL
ncbi:class II aldolase/adducin family protein [Geojedonia litorea]|uniref:Class II aldolase/adducin family protein n=1 Tax=Geojedonia litorea TaxID=1268269 RepID=A0ABV9N7A3_9FLAO